jgi:hypothetical protein
LNVRCANHEITKRPDRTTSLRRAQQQSKQLQSPWQTETKRENQGAAADHDDVERPSGADNHQHHGHTTDSLQTTVVPLIGCTTDPRRRLQGGNDAHGADAVQSEADLGLLLGTVRGDGEWDLNSATMDVTGIQKPSPAVVVRGPGISPSPNSHHQLPSQEPAPTERRGPEGITEN